LDACGLLFWEQKERERSKARKTIDNWIVFDSVEEQSVEVLLALLVAETRTCHPLATYYLNWQKADC